MTQTTSSMQRHDSGFTLVEILVAVAIFSIIGLSAYAVLDTVLKSDNGSQERFAKLEQLQRAMLFMERDVLQAVQRPVRANGQLQSSSVAIAGGRDLMESEADGLALVKGGWHNPQLLLPRSTLQAVGYRMLEEQLQRVHLLHLDNINGVEPKVRIMLEGVTDLQFEFLIGSGEDDTAPTWQESYQGQSLPRAIAVEITTRDFGEIRREWVVSG